MHAIERAAQKSDKCVYNIRATLAICNTPSFVLLPGHLKN